MGDIIDKSLIWHTKVEAYFAQFIVSDQQVIITIKSNLLIQEGFVLLCLIFGSSCVDSGYYLGPKNVCGQLVIMYILPQSVRSCDFIKIIFLFW